VKNLADELPKIADNANNDRRRECGGEANRAQTASHQSISSQPPRNLSIDRFTYEGTDMQRYFGFLHPHTDRLVDDWLTDWLQHLSTLFSNTRSNIMTSKRMMNNEQ